MTAEKESPVFQTFFFFFFIFTAISKTEAELRVSDLPLIDLLKIVPKISTYISSWSDR